MSDPSVAVEGTDPVPRDFAASSSPPQTATPSAVAQHPGLGDSRPSPHVHYALRIDPSLARDAPSGAAPALGRSDTEAALSPGIRRRFTRAGTFRTVDDFDDFTVRPGWHRMSTPFPPLPPPLSP